MHESNSISRIRFQIYLVHKGSQILNHINKSKSVVKSVIKNKQDKFGKYYHKTVSLRPDNALQSTLLGIYAEHIELFRFVPTLSRQISQHFLLQRAR
jgi:hypothetical protein